MNQPPPLPRVRPARSAARLLPWLGTMGILLVLGLGFGAGYLVGARQRPQVPSQARPDGPLRPGRVTRGANHAGAPGVSTAAPPITTVEQLRQALANQTDSYTLDTQIQLSSPEELRAALELCQNTPNTHLANSTTVELCAAWAKLDPAGAIRYASELTHHGRRSSAMLAVLGEWVESDFNAAAAYIKELPVGAVRAGAVALLPAELAKTAPQAALALINELAPGGSRRTGMINDVFGHWAKSAPAQAAAAALQLPNGIEAQEAAATVVNAWFQTEPDKALQWAESLPASLVRDRALVALIGQLAVDQPATAIRLLSQIGAVQGQQNAASNFASCWRDDPQTGLKWLEQLPVSRNRRQAEAQLIIHLNDSDPVRAAAIVAKLGYPPEINYRYLAHSLANADLAQAQQWALQLPTGSGRRDALEGLCEPLVAANPQQALQFVLGLPREDNPSQLLSSAVSTWADQDPAAARNWALGLTDNKLRADVLPDLFSSWAAEEPEAAIAAAAQLNGLEHAKVATQMAYTLGGTDPAAAAVWALQQPDPKTRPELVSVIGSQWASNDLEAYTRWTQALPAGPVRDSAVYVLASHLGDQDPTEALRWAATVQNSEKATELTVTLCMQWLHADPESARAWIATAKLADELKQQLLTEEPE